MTPRYYHTPPVPVSTRARCPVCQEAVYSRAGIHPQCAVRQYDPPSVATALAQAQAAGAYGADYIANILHQQRAPRSLQPPLALKDPELAQLATDPLSLLDYDALILTERKEP